MIGKSTPRMMLFTVPLLAAALWLSIAPARAGQGEWATAGKILTGVVGYQFLSGLVTARDRDRVVYERQVVYAPPPPPVVYVPPPPVREYRTDYYHPRYHGSYYRPSTVTVIHDRAPDPVVYVQQPAPPPTTVIVQQPAPAPVVVQQPAPAPAPVVIQQPAPAPAPVVVQAAPEAKAEITADNYVIVNVEDGKRLIQPKVRGAAATMQVWSEIRKEWVDVKEYPSIY